MKPGDLVQAPQWAFSFRTLEPEPAGPRRLLVLLHGVDGTEEQLAGLGREAGEGTLVVLPRGPRSISEDRIGWFRESMGEDGPRVVDEAESEEARVKLLEFLAQCQERRGIDPKSTVVAGFSQGGELAASAALTAPEGMAAFAVLGGRVLPETEVGLSPDESLSRLSALIVHGRDDDTIPVEWAHRAGELLHRLGVRHELRLHRGGHALSAAMQREFVRWHASLAAATGGPPGR